MPRGSVSTRSPRPWCAPDHATDPDVNPVPGEWAPLLSPFFASSAASTAAAALSLSPDAVDAPLDTCHRLLWLSVITGAAELGYGCLVGSCWQRQPVAAPVEEEPIGATLCFGVVGLGLDLRVVFLPCF